MGNGKFKQFPYIIIAAIMFTRVRQLLEMIRFSHTLFALPFALYRQAEQDVRSRQARPD